MVEDLHGHEVLLGSDAMEACGVEIYYESQEVRLSGNTFPMAYVGHTDHRLDGMVSEMDYWKECFPKLFPEKGAPLGTVTGIEMHVNSGDARPI